MMTKEKVLVLGTSFSALPIIRILKDLGYFVSTVGVDPHEVGHKFSDQSFLVDYSHYKTVAEIVADQNFKYIVPSCNDTAYHSSALLADKFPWLQNDKQSLAQYFLDKQKFKEVCETSQVLVPKKFGNVSEIDFTTVGEVIVKATDQSSGIGMSRCKSHEELNEALTLAKSQSKSGQIVIEEYISGPLMSFTTFKKDGKNYYTTSCDEFCNVTGFQVSSSRWPSSIGEPLKRKICDATARVEETLGIHSGMTHYQIIIHNSEPYFIEAMRRCPGDLFPRGVELSENFDFYRHYVSYFINSISTELFTYPKPLSIHREVFYPKFEIVNQGIQSDFNIHEYYPLSSIGDIVKSAPFGKIGIAFCKSTHKEQTKKKSDWFSMTGYMK